MLPSKCAQRDKPSRQGLSESNSHKGVSNNDKKWATSTTLSFIMWRYHAPPDKWPVESICKTKALSIMLYFYLKCPGKALDLGYLWLIPCVSTVAL